MICKYFLNSIDIDKVDVIFLLSLGSWIKNWRELYTQSLVYSDVIILETNNDIEGKPQLDFFKSLNCSITLLSDTSNDDTTGNYGRKTYILKNI